MQVNLKYYEIQGMALNLLKSYLLGRNQYVNLDYTHSDIQEVHCAIPQGYVMGPLLFNIFINDSVEVNSRYDFIMYADETIFPPLTIDHPIIIYFR